MINKIEYNRDMIDLFVFKLTKIGYNLPVETPNINILQKSIDNNFYNITLVALVNHYDFMLHKNESLIYTDENISDDLFCSRLMSFKAAIQQATKDKIYFHL